MKVLVTGGLGILAQPITAQLLRDGHEVVAFDWRGQAKHGPQMQTIYGDIREMAALRRAAHSCEALIHLAAVSGTATDDALFAINVGGTLNALSVARDCGWRRVVMTSSAPVHLAQGHESSFPLLTGTGGDHLYDLSKALQEVIAHDYAQHGLEVVCLRLGHVVDGQNASDLKGRPLAHLAYCRGGWVDLGDVARAVVAALTAVVPDKFTLLNLISSVGARGKYDVGRTTTLLGIDLAYDFAEYP